MHDRRFTNCRGIAVFALAPSVGAGVAFFALGFLLEVIGLALEHRDPRG
jgi:hypothetical protein